MKVFVFGNSIVRADSLPLQLLPALTKHFPDIRFIHVDPTENWYQEEKELVILDTVIGIKKVALFTSLEAFETQTKVTPHDYDLYMDLQLLMKVGKVKKVTIIGVPAKQSKAIVKQVLNTLSLL